MKLQQRQVPNLGEDPTTKRDKVPAFDIIFQSRSGVTP